jgi:D-xylose transport system substrate-binding protein
VDGTKRLASDLASGRLSRRDVLRYAALLGVSSAGLVPLLAGCSSDDGGDQAGGGGGERLRIGFSLPTLSQRRWQFDKRYVEEYAKQKGAEVFTEAAQDDDRLQLNQVQNLIAKGIDVLILSPFNVQTAGPAVTAAKQAKIPVVSYNSLVLDATLDYWVARDNVAVGRLQADLAVKAKPEGNYVIVSGEPGVDIAQQKTQGNQEVLKPFIDQGAIKVVSQEYHRGWDPALGLRQVENALTKTGNKVDAILCNYDGFVLTALEALGKAGLVGTTWLGGEDVFDQTAQGIVEGTVAMSAYTDLKQMATKAVDAAFALANGQKPASDATIDNGAGQIPGSRIASFAVTKENMDQFLKDTGWLTPDVVYKNATTTSQP